jgi:carotenoid cleavage dioxygenase-like enzyme
MKRRDFITHLGLLSSLSLVPRSLMAADDLAKSTFELFNDGLLSHPNLIGYQNYTQERVVGDLKIEGQFPKEFNGSYYRNGPALLERNEVRYEHLFEGDGMIHAFNFDNGKVDYKNKFVQTSKFKAEQNADRFLYDFSNIGIKDPQSITSADSINSANTNIVPVGDEIWALWEAGSAHRMDAKTLETKGVVTLSDNLKGMPFSAHPKVDADGTIWNFGLDYGSGKIIMYRLSSNGSMQKFGIIDANYHAMLHDFLITKNHILMILPSLRIDPKAKSFMQQQSYNKDQPMKVLVVDKNDFSLKSTHEFPACFLFHFGNAWEEKDGSIKFDGCRYPDLKIMDIIEDVMVGKTSTNKQSFSQSVLFTIHPNGKTKQEFFDGITEFPRIYPSLTGLKAQKIFTIGGEKEHETMHSIRSVNVDTGKIDEYDYGSDYLVEEHVVVEKGSTPQKNGWLIGTALHWPSKKSCVSLFEAENLAAGPIAKAWLPFHIPLGFHGNFKKA